MGKFVKYAGYESGRGNYVDHIPTVSGDIGFMHDDNSMFFGRMYSK